MSQYKSIRMDREILARLQAAFKNVDAPKASDAALVAWCLEDYVGIREDQQNEQRS